MIKSVKTVVISNGSECFEICSTLLGNARKIQDAKPSTIEIHCPDL